MNKIFKSIVGALVILGAVLAMNVDAYAASVTLTGPGTVRAGDTIQLNLVIAESGRNAIEGTFSYDSSQVTLNSVTTAMSGWKVETNGNTIMAYDENMTNPTKANSVVATAAFTVKSTVAAGATVKISLNNTAVAASSASYDIGTVTYSVVIAKPLSGVNTLSALKVDGCNLSPAFSADTTTYNAGEVDFSVATLNVTAIPAEGTAKVAVAGNNLSVGNNTITIAVTAENGSIKYYQINVVRKQDPNYVASSNADVSQMNVSQGKISPAFKSDVTDYVIYVPYEEMGNRFEVSGSAVDTKATGVQSGVIEALTEGNNTTKLVCTAEDGTTKEYNVTVVVMPEYNGQIPVIGDNDVEEPITEEPTTEEATTKPSEEASEELTTEPEATTVASDNDEGNTKTGLPTWSVVLMVLAGVLVGFGACFLILTLKKKKED